jgi:hypothetical protein
MRPNWKRWWLVVDDGLSAYADSSYLGIVAQEAGLEGIVVRDQVWHGLCIK